MQIKSKSIISIILFLLFVFNLIKSIDNSKSRSNAIKLRNAFNKNINYYPTKYHFPKEEDFCFSSSLGCTHSNRYKVKGNPYDEILRLNIFLKGEAYKKRLIEISNKIFQRYDFRPMEIKFWINGEDLPLIDISSHDLKQISWALGTMRVEFSEPKLDLMDARWHSDGIKGVIKKMQIDLKSKKEKLVGVWIPTKGKYNLGPGPSKMYFVIQKKTISGKLKWKYGHYSPGGKYYIYKPRFSTKKKTKFRFDENYFHVSCDLNGCGDLIGITSFENILKNNSLIN